MGCSLPSLLALPPPPPPPPPYYYSSSSSSSSSFFFLSPPLLSPLQTIHTHTPLCPCNGGCVWHFYSKVHTLTVRNEPLQPTDWERIFTNPKSDRGLIYNIYKELKKVDSIKSNNSIKNGAQTELNKEFSPKEYRMAEKHLKKCSTSLIIREMQIKTTLRFHLTPVRIAKMKNSGDSRCWRGCEERGTLLHC